MNTLLQPATLEALSLDEALRRATSLAEALRQMHRDGMFSGCLDPKYILWDKDDVKLAWNGASGMSAYFAPEQVCGEAADARSDIFAFGAILYELLSGHKAFPAEDPEELAKQILESSPEPPAGIPDGIASLLRACLEKNRDLRMQRMNSILIELKLAAASARQASAASEWIERVASLRSQVAAHDERLGAQQAAQESMGAEIARIHEILAAIGESIAALQKSGQVDAKAIESLQVASSQTDEVVEHVVEAFGRMHKSMVERGETKILLVSRNGN